MVKSTLALRNQNPQPFHSCPEPQKMTQSSIKGDSLKETGKETLQIQEIRGLGRWPAEITRFWLGSLASDH